MATDIILSSYSTLSNSGYLYTETSRIEMTLIITYSVLECMYLIALHGSTPKISIWHWIAARATMKAKRTSSTLKE